MTARFSWSIAARFPWGCALVALAATAAMCAGPAAFDAMAWDRDAIVGGEWWRILTGNLVHASWDHFAWDLAMWLLLGIYVELKSRSLLIWICASTAALLHLSLLGTGRFERYCGLSGFDVGLFGAAGAWALLQGLEKRDAWIGAVGVVALFGVSLKIGYELLSGGALFASVGGSAMMVAVEAHLAGLLAGVGCVLLRQGERVELRWLAAGARRRRR